MEKQREWKNRDGTENRESRGRNGEHGKTKVGLEKTEGI